MGKAAAKPRRDRKEILKEKEGLDTNI